MTDTPTPSGPIWGPGERTISTPDGDVAVRPDANNPALQASGQPARYYVEPARVRLARRDTGDFDFNMQAFVKGPPGPAVEYLGGTCTFAATLAVSQQALTTACQQLLAPGGPQADEQIAAWVHHSEGDPPPTVGVVPVQRSSVDCVIDHPSAPLDAGAVSVAPQGSGSIEVQGRNSFLVTCSAAATREIVANLRDNAVAPFTIRYRLTEQFHTGTRTGRVEFVVNVDAAQQAFTSIPGSAPLTGDELEAMYAAAVAQGAVRFKSNDDGLISWLIQTDVVKAAVLSQVKELFDVEPATTAEVRDFGWWDGVFGGGSTVILSAGHARHGLQFAGVVAVEGTVNVVRTVDGTLDDLTIAAKADIGKYLTVLNVGGF